MENHEFPREWKEGVYHAIEHRRDMRRFLPDPIPDGKLARVLRAAHHAGSVGYMQPWNFIVIADRDKRRLVRDHVDACRVDAAGDFDGERREKYLALKLEGILDAPINVCVTCDRERGGGAVLGRHTIRDTDLYSTCCAIQNFWLAARAEGIGVGWVSILEPDRLREIFGMPAHVLPVAYLCVGFVERFPDRPELETEGWLPRRPMEEVVFSDGWDQPVSPELLAEIAGVAR